ncbi:MAG: PaaX family transcriptional regulator C-terminal domain-containing protein [Chloroflexota bacterium]
MVQPHTIIFTLYGAYIEPRGGVIWAGSLIKALAAFGISEQAARKVLSRMRRKGWLQVRKHGRQSYYFLTEAGSTLTKAGGRRGLAPKAATWSGEWHLLTYRIPEAQRQLRDRLRQRLAWMGYASLSSSTWISPYDRGQDLDRTLALLRVQGYVERFTARYQESRGNKELAARLWDLTGLNQRCRAFLTKYQAESEEHKGNLARGEELDLERCFVRRFELMLDYMDIGFADPNLPPELLPDDWAGREAEALFREYRDLLTEPANHFFDSVFKGPPPQPTASNRSADR